MPVMHILFDSALDNLPSAFLLSGRYQGCGFPIDRQTAACFHKIVSCLFLAPTVVDSAKPIKSQLCLLSHFEMRNIIFAWLEHIHRLITVREGYTSFVVRLSK